VAKLNAAARAAIREAGFTLSEWARVSGYADGKWGGDACGCTDTGRCMNGFHHYPEEDCGCLRTMIDDAVAWRQAATEPNSVALAAPFGLFRWVNVTTPGSLVTVSATAGGFRADSPAETVIRIEAREGWTATVGEENGHMVVRLVKAAAPEAEAPEAGMPVADDELKAIRDREQARDVPALVAAVEVALAPHRRSFQVAWGQGSGGCHGKYFCLGCSVDDVKREWPCKPYQDIARALLGKETGRG
jgi:hypothetical protein